MGIYSQQFIEMARSCGMDYMNGRLVIVGGSPCGTFADDWRNIAIDLRRVIKKYNGKEK